MLMSYAPPIVRLVLAALLMACVPAVYAQSKDPIEVGAAALDRNHFATAYRAWIGPARKGDAMAQNNVGYLYEHGLGLTQSYVEAMAWYRKAANKNLAQAQYNIGTLYYYGYGVERNTREAVRWFRQAAKQELTEGQYMLGVAYYEGQGTVKSAPKSDKSMLIVWLALAPTWKLSRPVFGGVIFVVAASTTPPNVPSVRPREVNLLVGP